MSSIRLKKPTTLDALQALLRSSLSARCSVEVKGERLRVVENGAKGCSVSLLTREDQQVCHVAGLMPSMALRAATFVGVMLVFALSTSLILGEFNIVVGGAIPFLIVFFAVRLPSRDLVANVSAIIGHELGATGQPEPQSQRSWLLAGIAVGVIVLGVLAVINWPASKSATAVVSTATAPAIEPPMSEADLAALTPAEDLPQEYSLVANLRGRIEFLHSNLKQGGIIPKDTVILRINAGDLNDELRRAEEQLQYLNRDLATLKVEASVAEAAAAASRRELARVEAEYSKVQATLNGQRATGQQLEAAEYRLALSQQATERSQRDLDGIAKRSKLVESQIADAERELEALQRRLEHAEISLPVDVRVDLVNVEIDEFVAVGSVLFESTEVED